MARILYVEDNPAHRKPHVEAFKAAGHEVTACADYPAARVAIDATLAVGKPYDIVVSDGQYPSDGKRFLSGPHQDFAGSACLLADHKALGLTMPVVVLSDRADFLKDNPYPADCTRPFHILSKVDNMPRQVAANIPSYIAEGITPSG